MARPFKPDQTLDQRLDAVEMFLNRKIRRPKTIIDYLMINFNVTERTAKRDIETVTKSRRTPPTEEGILGALTEITHEYDALYQKEYLKKEADDHKLLSILDKQTKQYMNIQKILKGRIADVDAGSRTPVSDALKKFQGSYSGSAGSADPE